MKYFFCLILSVSSLTSSAKIASFLDYCSMYKKNPQAISSDVAKTVIVLLEYSEQSDCEKSYEILKSISFLDLSHKGLTNLIPLSGLENVKDLNISHNDLKSLWGIERLPSIQLLSANNNKIEDITAISYLKELFFCNLDNNKILYVSPLKEIINLRDLFIENNPVSNNEEAMDYLEGMITLRTAYKNRPFVINIDPDNISEFIYDIEMSAKRGDLVLLRKLFRIDEIRQLFDDERLIRQLSDQTKKTILAIKESKRAAREIFSNFDLYIKEHLSHILHPGDLLFDMEEKFSLALELFIHETPHHPYNKLDLCSLKEWLKQYSIKFKTVRPENLLNQCHKWQKNIIEKQLPPSLKTGFLGF